jgi:hypothetical protein
VLVKGNDTVYLTMMKPEDRVKSRHFWDAHIAKAEDVVETIMQCFNIANAPTIRLGAPLIVGLKGSE